MRRNLWMTLAAAIASGAVLLQTGGCAQLAPVITAGATTVAAGGVLFIVSRILQG